MNYRLIKDKLLDNNLNTCYFGEVQREGSQKMPPRPKSKADYLKKFLAHIDEKADGCYFPTYSLNLGGYARMMVNGKQMYLQQVSMWLHRPDIYEEGLPIYSTCPNNKCVNPAHLSYVRPANHTRRARAFSVEEIKQNIGVDHIQELLQEFDNSPELDIHTLAAKHNYGLLIIAQMVRQRSQLGFPLALNKGTQHE